MGKPVLQQFDDQIRRNCRFPDCQVDRLECVTRVTGNSTHQLDNLIVWSDLDAETADGEINTQTEYFKRIGHNFEWLVYGHDTPQDLVSRLLARGLERESEEQVVIAEAGAIAEHLVPTEVDLLCLNDPKQVPDAVAVQDAVWGNSQHDILTRWLTAMVGKRADESIVLVAYADGRPIASAWASLWADRSFAPLFGGSVFPEWRGRGIYRAMVSARATAASSRGIRWCLVDAGADSAPILKRLGFQVLTSRTGLRWTTSPNNSG